MQRGGDLQADDIVVPRIHPGLDADGSMSTEVPGMSVRRQWSRVVWPVSYFCFLEGI